MAKFVPGSIGIKLYKQVLYLIYAFTRNYTLSLTIVILISIVMHALIPSTIRRIPFFGAFFGWFMGLFWRSIQIIFYFVFYPIWFPCHCIIQRIFIRRTEAPAQVVPDIIDIEAQTPSTESPSLGTNNFQDVVSIFEPVSDEQ